ncbi:MAG: hypothetical protein AAF615_01705 [Pseudomonadota bacterium]
MLKRTYDRSYANTMGEPEAWERHASASAERDRHAVSEQGRGAQYGREHESAREAARSHAFGDGRGAVSSDRRAAPWHRPYGEDHASASDFARRPAQPHLPTQPHLPASQRGSTLVSPASHSDFRNLARSIERLRHTRGDDAHADADRYVADAPPATSRRERTRSLWLDNVRNTVAADRAQDSHREVEHRTPQPDPELRRLEALVRELSDRVGRLEETRPASRFDVARERADAAAAALDAAYQTPQRPQRATARRHSDARTEGAPRRLWP